MIVVPLQRVLGFSPLAAGAAPLLLTIVMLLLPAGRGAWVAGDRAPTPGKRAVSAGDHPAPAVAHGHAAKRLAAVTQHATGDLHTPTRA